MQGTYTPPRRFAISGIDTLLVDPHNEVIPLWYELDEPSVLIHVDEHHDMNGGSMTFRMAKRWFTDAKIDTVEDYAKKCLGVANFISAAIHDHKVVVVYHVNPRTGKIMAYGRIHRNNLINPPKTKAYNKGVHWPVGSFSNVEEITTQCLVGDLDGTKYPLLLDIDLDGIHWSRGDRCLREDSPNIPFQPRIDYIRTILRSIKRPAKITISRSQTPLTHVYPSLVEEIQTKTIAMLEQVYGN
jgi:hypothetical protein